MIYRLFDKDNPQVEMTLTVKGDDVEIFIFNLTQILSIFVPIENLTLVLKQLEKEHGNPKLTTVTKNVP